MNNDWVQKYIEGNSSPEETEAVVKWLHADDKNMRAYMTLRKQYDICLWYELDKSGILESKSGKSRRLFLELLKVAAVFAVAFLCIPYLYPPRLSGEEVVMQTVYAPSGQRTEVILTDGTKVWLNAKSTLTFPNKFMPENREVTLNGEGYFDVTHDVSRPFIVKTGPYDITVMGTEFNVIAYKGTNIFETALIKGSVEVSSTTGQDKIRLVPNQEVVAINGALKRKAIDDFSYFMWRDGLICFDDESVEEILNKIRLYYDIEIKVSNKSILKHRYTGKFRTKDGVEHVLKVLQLRNKFQYEKNDELNTIVIK